MTVVHCETEHSLLNELHRLQTFKLSGNWTFRGQANASWTLRPSLFRLEISKEREFERALISRLRFDLKNRSTIPDRLLSDSDYVLAVAQHYGCPTRMLDWTLNPLAAAYFAASGSLSLRDGQPMAVFAIAGISSLASRNRSSQFVYPPSGGNENIAAQCGVLVKHDWDCRDYWCSDYELPVVKGEPPVDASINSRFIRFELPATSAHALLAELQSRGVDGVSLFPGLYGFAKAAQDDAWEFVRAASDASAQQPLEEEETVKNT